MASKRKISSTASRVTKRNKYNELYSIVTKDDYTYIQFKNIEARALYANIAYDTINNIDNKEEQCLEYDEIDKLNLKKSIKLLNPMGSISGEGEIFRSMVSTSKVDIYCSVKLMRATNNNRREVKILQELSDLVKNNLSINLPIMYNDYFCNNFSSDLWLPRNILNKEYLIIINELAAGDLYMLLNSPQITKEILNNAIIQIVFSLYTLHSLGYIHNDVHCKNFLFHHIEANNYIKYNIDGNNCYLPNLGYLWIVWDFGLTIPLNDDNKYKCANDYYTLITSLIDVLANRQHMITQELLELKEELEERLQSDDFSEYEFIQQVLDIFHLLNTTHEVDTINNITYNIPIHERHL